MKLEDFVKICEGDPTYCGMVKGALEANGIRAVILHGPLNNSVFGSGFGLQRQEIRIERNLFLKNRPLIAEILKNF